MALHTPNNLVVDWDLTNIVIHVDMVAAPLLDDNKNQVNTNDLSGGGNAWQITNYFWSFPRIHVFLLDAHSAVFISVISNNQTLEVRGGFGDLLCGPIGGCLFQLGHFNVTNKN